jgi:hypothetical protein
MIDNGKDTTDYRAALERELKTSWAFGGNPDRRARILDGFAAQVLREDSERKRKELEIPDDKHREVITDALKEHGFVPGAAAEFVREFTQGIRAAALADSDHQSYRELADAVNNLIGELADPDSWDGDDSEVGLLIRFLEWLPDIVCHRGAEKIRERYMRTRKVGEWPLADRIAEIMDPFVLTAGEWLRKSDGSVVPWSVMGE